MSRDTVEALLRGRLPLERWTEVSRLLADPAGPDPTTLANLAFEARVHARPAPAEPSPAGKGSPGALLTIGAVSTLLLGGFAAALGGGALYGLAAIPAVTVAAVLLARMRAASSETDGATVPSASEVVPAPPSVAATLAELVS